jgi:hypothetical protein
MNRPHPALRPVGYPDRTQDSLLAAAQALPDGIGYPQGFQRKVSVMLLTSLPPFPGFSWRRLCPLFPAQGQGQQVPMVTTREKKKTSTETVDLLTSEAIKRFGIAATLRPKFGLHL